MNKLFKSLVFACATLAPFAAHAQGNNWQWRCEVERRLNMQQSGPCATADAWAAWAGGGRAAFNGNPAPAAPVQQYSAPAQVDDTPEYLKSGPGISVKEAARVRAVLARMKKYKNNIDVVGQYEFDTHPTVLIVTKTECQADAGYVAFLTFSGNDDFPPDARDGCAVKTATGINFDDGVKKESFPNDAEGWTLKKQ
jgi:hypothetical protein